MKKLLLLLLLAGCGRQNATETVTQPAPTDAEYVAIAPLVAKNCGSCHNGSFQAKLDTPQRVKGAKGRIASGSMPPAPKTISAQDKAKLLAYASK